MLWPILFHCVGIGIPAGLLHTAYPVCVYSISAGPLGTYLLLLLLLLLLPLLLLLLLPLLLLLLLLRHKSLSVFIHGDERRTWRDVV